VQLWSVWLTAFGLVMHRLRICNAQAVHLVFSSLFLGDMERGGLAVCMWCCLLLSGTADCMQYIGPVVLTSVAFTSLQQLYACTVSASATRGHNAYTLFYIVADRMQPLAVWS
jgi:hypothetical protein